MKTSIISKQLLLPSTKFFTRFASTSAAPSFPAAEEQDGEETTKTNASKIKTSLNERHRTLVEGGIPPVTYDFEKQKWAQKQRFGTFGMASGVDIRTLWPTVEEVEEAKALKLYRKHSEAAEIALKNKEAKEKAVKAKIAEIHKNEKQYEKKLAEYYSSQEKVEGEKSEQDKIQERRIREIQEYFGYWIDPKDPRFDVMLKQKEAEEKKAEKMAKRMAAEKKKIAAG